MACVSGTNIVNDGLVFHFDLENGVKSFKGKPTTNLYTTASKTFTQTNQYPIQPPVNKVENGGTWTNFNWSGDINIGNVYAGEYITVSGWYLPYTTDISIVKTVHIGLHCWSSRGSEGVALNAPNWNEWVYFEYTRYVDTDVTSFRIEDRGYDYYYPDNAQYTSAYWCNVQIERSEFATKFVNGVRLDTASIIDLSPNQNTITAANLTYRQDDTPTFDGTDDTLYVGDTNTLNFGTNDLTLESWFKKADDQDSWRSIFQKGTSGQPGYGMHIYNNRLSASIQATYNQHNTHSETLNPNVWYNCSIVFDRDVGIFSYINGELVGNYPYAAGNDGSIDNTTNRIQIGAYNSQWNFYGEISQVKIYDKALTDTEVKQNFEATRTRYGI